MQAAPIWPVFRAAVPVTNPVSDKMRPCMRSFTHVEEGMRSFLDGDDSARHEFRHWNGGSATLYSRTLLVCLRRNANYMSKCRAGRVM
jgi:hypothetical protein